MMDAASGSETCSLSVADMGDDPGQVLIRDENSIFKPLRTIPIAVLQIILQAGLFVESIWLFKFANNCRNDTITSTNEAKTPPTSLLELECSSFVIYCYAILWALALMLHWWRKFFHRDRRSIGYLSIYDHVATVSRVPFIGMSIGGFVLLVVLALKQDDIFFNNTKVLGEPSLWFFLEILAGIELLVTMLSLSFYISRVHKFNRSQPVPDVFNVTNISTMPVAFNSRSIVEIGPGIRECNNDIAILQTVCERQGDLIKYLRRRCDVLSHRLEESARRGSG